MSTFVDFVPSTQSAFSFQPTLGDTQYNVSITWNIFAQGFYLNLTDLSGNLILARSLTPSGPTMQSTITWASGLATVLSASNHNVPVGTLANISVSGSGTIMDGDWQALATGPNTLTYAVGNPNQVQPATVVLEFPWDLVQGYTQGFLLFHADTQQFEYA